LHLVFGGELVDLASTKFKNVDDIHIVVIFPIAAVSAVDEPEIP